MSRRPRLVLESCEPRLMPAQFGLPWYYPNLSLSLMPDGTPIAGHTSNLHEAMNSQDPSGSWREIVLTAFQTWAAVSKLNFAYRADGGQPLGTPGKVQGDPRFGDLRIGAHAMSPEVLAISVPPGADLASTLSGDVLLNSAYQFNGEPYSLLAVMLHEAGHTLGLSNSTLIDSVMYSQYNTTRTTLSPEDIARIQALYGVRTPDGYEGPQGNHSLATASPLRQPTLYMGDTPLVAFGDISTSTDVDVYQFRVPAIDDDDDDDDADTSVTIRLQTSGRSLLAAKLTIFDQQGQAIAEVSSTSITGDILQLTLDDLEPDNVYYIQIESATPDVFGIGRYGLSVRFDEISSVPDDLIEQLLTGPYELLNANQIDAFFRNSGNVLFEREFRANDTFTRAVGLVQSPGYAQNPRFERLASLSNRWDVDVYSLIAPQGTSRVLTATVFSIDQSGFQPRIRIFDQLGRPLPVQILSQENGANTIQVLNTIPGQRYFLRVSLSRSATLNQGNYLLNAGFNSVAAQLNRFSGGWLNQSRPQQSSRLYIAQAQLFRMVLTAGGQNLNSSIRLTLHDENGQEVMELLAHAGEAASGSRLLLPGAYQVTVTILNPNARRVAYRITGGRESDPIGPVLSDSTLDPRYTTPNSSPTTPPYFAYPGFSVPYDPSRLPGYVVPGNPSTYPPGFILPPGLSDYPWLIVTHDPYYWISLGL